LLQLKEILHADITIFTKQGTVSTILNPNYATPYFPDHMFAKDKVLSKKNPSFETLTLDGQRHRFYFTALFGPNSSREGVFALSLPLGEVQTQQKEGFKLMLLVALVLCLLATLAGFIAAQSLVKTLEVLRSAVQKIDQGDWNAHINVQTNDEFSDLARSFNTMTQHLKSAQKTLEEYSHGLENKVKERTSDLQKVNEDLKQANLALQQSQEQLIQAAKMTSIGTLAAGIAHEFNNIVAGMLGYADFALHSKDPDKMADALGVVRLASERARSITSGLLAFAKKKESGKQEYVSINDLIQQALAIIEWELSKANIQVVRHYDAKLPNTLCNPTQIMQVLFNLLTNAHDAMIPTRGGILTITSRTINNWIEVRVQDTGVGIPEEDRQKIFEPFYSSKGKAAIGDRGSIRTGLGLAISWGFIEAHYGILEVESKEGQGATFIVKLPITQSPRLVATPSLEPIEIQGSHRVLVVDDEDMIRELLTEMLLEKNQLVKGARNGKEALELLKQEKFDLVIADLTMPLMNGIDLLKAMKQHGINVPVYVITGQVISDDIDQAIELGAKGALRKPFDLDEITKLIALLE
jgi:signal transduction histidine kinase